MADITHQQLLDAINKSSELLAGVAETVAGHGKQLASITEILTGHSKQLASITEILTGHSKLLDRHSELIAKNSKLITENSELTAGIAETVAKIADNMATKQDLKKLEARFDHKMDNLELRLGRRIDTVLSAKTST